MNNFDRFMIGFLCILIQIHGCAIAIDQELKFDKAVKEIKTSIEEVKQQSYKGIK